MKNRFSMLRIVILFFCAFLFAPARADEMDETKAFRIHTALPAYVFSLHWRKNSDYIDRIEVHREGDQKVIQTIEDAELQTPPPGFEHLQVEDINFDGYKDLKIFGWAGATGNVGYSYWLFQKKTGRFVFHEKLSDLCDPEPNQKTKEIISYCKGGMVGQEYTEQTFKWSKKGKLILVREERQEWVDEKEHFLKTIKIRRRGKLTIISRDIVE